MKAKFILAANVFPVLGLVAAPLLCMMTPFLFDSPDSVKNPFVYGMALAVWSYPLTAGFGGVLAVKAYRAGDLHRLWKWTLCAYSSIAAFFACAAVGGLLS